MILTYNTISQEATTEYKDRGSRFIGIAFPVNNADEFKKELKKLKADHPKANHHCFAYRLGTDNDNFRSTDDGEPAGTAGKPILGQIDSKGLTDTAVVVVRYFGGTLLGVPGLISAYKTTASLVLQVVPVVTKKLMKQVKINFTHPDTNIVMQILKQTKAEILEQNMQLFCDITAKVPLDTVEYLGSLFAGNENVEIIWK